jgi:hypothetical protein
MVVGTYSRSVIDHIIDLCGFPSDSIMIKYIKGEGWTDLGDVTSLSLHDVNDFQLANDASYKGKPLAVHVRRLRGFLLYYSKKCCELSFTLDKDDVMMISKKELEGYLGTPAYHMDLRMHLQREGLKANHIKATEEDSKVIDKENKVNVIKMDNEAMKDTNIKVLRESDDEDTAAEFLLYDQIIAFIEQDNLDMVDDMEQVDFIKEGSFYDVVVEWETGGDSV